MVVEAETKIEVEVFGVTYERFALAKLFERLVKRLKIKTVLEWPAAGAKAMPSLYSVGFALAGCRVTLVDADPEAVLQWDRLGLQKNLEVVTETDAIELSSSGRRWDLCWNFVVLPTSPDPIALVNRMAAAASEYLMFIHVNKHNVGFLSHKMVHRLNEIPWTHGDLRFFSPFSFRSFLRKLGFGKVKWGVVDCPPWPDSLGFRDLRLHRQGEYKLRWKSPYIDYLESGKFPSWFDWVYRLERLPIPAWMKLPYAHLYYTLIRVEREVTR
ncbi:MAG: hypothetical protein NTW14_04755 [bacterium]|nr:hypothetical protein [bacterium]